MEWLRLIMESFFFLGGGGGLFVLSVQSDQFVLQYASRMMHQKQDYRSEILVKNV